MCIPKLKQKAIAPPVRRSVPNEKKLPQLALCVKSRHTRTLPHLAQPSYSFDYKQEIPALNKYDVRGLNSKSYSLLPKSYWTRALGMEHGFDKGSKLAQCHEQPYRMTEMEVTVFMSTQFLTEAEVAERTHISLATLRRWRLERRGPTYRKFGSLVRYDEDDLAAWEHAQPAGGTEPGRIGPVSEQSMPVRPARLRR